MAFSGCSPCRARQVAHLAFKPFLLPTLMLPLLTCSLHLLLQILHLQILESRVPFTMMAFLFFPCRIAARTPERLDSDPVLILDLSCCASPSSCGCGRQSLEACIQQELVAKGYSEEFYLPYGLTHEVFLHNFHHIQYHHLMLRPLRQQRPT